MKRPQRLPKISAIFAVGLACLLVIADTGTAFARSGLRIGGGPVFGGVFARAASQSATKAAANAAARAAAQSAARAAARNAAQASARRAAARAAQRTAINRAGPVAQAARPQRAGKVATPTRSAALPQRRANPTPDTGGKPPRPPGGTNQPPRGPRGPTFGGAPVLLVPAIIPAAVAVAALPRDAGGAAGAPPSGVWTPPPPSPPTAATPVPALPPANERRYVPDEILFELSNSAPPGTLASVVQRYRLTAIAAQPLPLVGTTLYRYRIPNRRSVPGVVRDLSADGRLSSVQPNYLFTLAETRTEAAPIPGQYAAEILRLPQVHRIARGERILVAVIDSGIDDTHPETRDTIAERFDALGEEFQPHSHGTGMAGAIVAHASLTGVSPAARILAVRAFGQVRAKPGGEGTSFHIAKGLDWAANRGARVINMSFAGPADPLIARAVFAARERGIVLIAAMGNAGPKAPPGFPAADPNVIAVTAIDGSTQLFAQATRGPHVAVAAPGVDVLLPAPAGAYQITSGTSVAAAHVSGVVALVLERAPLLSPHDIRLLLARTSTREAASPPDIGAGLVNPLEALSSLPGAVPATVTPTAATAGSVQPATAPRQSD